MWEAAVAYLAGGVSISYPYQRGGPVGWVALGVQYLGRAKPQRQVKGNLDFGGRNFEVQ
jgi:hypothetical protein